MIKEFLNGFADGALRYAADNYRTPATPLLADAYHNGTKAHFRRDYGKRRECQDVVFSNLARQMNFMRVLEIMRLLYGEPRYADVFRDNYDYYVKHYQHENGLFAWGGHRMVDLKTLLTTGEMTHELKSDYPAYPLMLKINREKTLKYMEAFWNAHIMDWETLEVSRHGDYEKVMGKLWDNGFLDPEPFIEVIGLSFINAGSDLIFSACEYYKATGNEKALLWARRLENMYYKSRDKETGLGVYQFNQPKARHFSDDYTITVSSYGDRAKRQMGPELGEGCLEGNMMLSGKTRTIYGYSMLVLLHEALSMPGTETSEIFKDHCKSGLEAFATHAYNPETNMFRPMLANGRDLTDFELQRDGYYGKKGTVFRRYPANGLNYLVFSKTAEMTGSGLLRRTASSMESHNQPTDCPYFLLAYINQYNLTGDAAFLDKAERIAANIAEKGTEHNKHLLTRHEYVSLNSIAPLAMAAYLAAREGKLGEADVSVYV
jgi:pectate lyase